MHGVLQLLLKILKGLKFETINLDLGFLEKLPSLGKAFGI